MVETLIMSPDEKTEGPVKINIEEINSQKILEMIGEQTKNLLKTEEEIEKFFNKEENKKSNELMITTPCNTRIVSCVRKKITGFLFNKGVVKSEAEKYEFNTLAGEVIRDTLHSLSQEQIKNPNFIVRLNNLNYPKEFSFDIINPDRVPCESWPRFSSGGATERVTGDEDMSEGKHSIGYGPTLLESVANSLGAKIYYSNIKNQKGEKEYTLFHFEFKKE